MNRMRAAWRVVVAVALACGLAACAKNTVSQPASQPASTQDAAAQDVAAQDSAMHAAASTTVAPPSASTRMQRTGGPLPPVQVCRVDADCAGTLRCKDTPCRCVRTRCIALLPAIDPVVDPVPPAPPQT